MARAYVVGTVATISLLEFTDKLDWRNMMKLKTLTLATGFALSAMSVAGVAQASALATSVLDVTNFTISGASGQLKTSDFVGIVSTDTADISATLGATTDAQLNLSSPGTGIDTVAPVSVGTVVPAYTNNSFAVYTNPPQGTFTLADQLIVGSPIDGGTAHAGQASYVSLLAAPADGSATANNGLNSSFVFTLASAGSITLGFDARAYLEAFTSNDSLFPTSASSQYSLTFAIDAPNGNVFKWSPDGTTNLGTGVLSELDPFSLNEAISANSPFPFTGAFFRGASLGNANTGTFSATSLLLAASIPYTFTIRSTATADATTVPEPATLALLGLGLVGLGLSRRRA
jgi:hypothetical protein